MSEQHILKYRFDSVKNWSTEDKAEELFDILDRLDERIRPQRFMYMDKKIEFSAENKVKFVENWIKKKGIYVESKSLSFWLDAYWVYGNKKRFNKLIGGIKVKNTKMFDSLNQWKDLLLDFFNWGEMCYGYCCYDKEFEGMNILQKPVMINGKLTGTGGSDLSECLPGIYWLNFFGEVYFDWFGEKLKQVECFKSDILNNKAIIIEAYKDPLSFDLKENKEIINNIIKCLGQENFFEKSHPQKSCKAPTFVFEQLTDSEMFLDTIFDPVKIIFPEPQEFLNQIPTLIESLNKKFKGKNNFADFSIEKLKIIDDYVLKRSKTIIEPWKEDESINLLRELSAYYGEFLRLNLKGNWKINKMGYPCILFYGVEEIPFITIYKLWLERNRCDGTVMRYEMLSEFKPAKFGSLIKKVLNIQVF